LFVIVSMVMWRTSSWIGIGIDGLIAACRPRHPGLFRTNLDPRA
jgi:hypothetical protein